MWDWDEAKRQANLAKHGVDFAMVSRFDWTGAVIEPDARFDYGELRLIATGMVGDRLHVVIYTERDGQKRIIGLRKANSREFERWITRAAR
jgi:uncharacterized protein